MCVSSGSVGPGGPQHITRSGVGEVPRQGAGRVTEMELRGYSVAGRADAAWRDQGRVRREQVGYPAQRPSPWRWSVSSPLGQACRRAPVARSSRPVVEGAR